MARQRQPIGSTSFALSTLEVMDTNSLPLRRVDPVPLSEHIPGWTKPLDLIRE
jgi:hypothetical protein